MNKLVQARLALNEAISLGGSQDPRGAILHDVTCTLNDMLHAPENAKLQLIAAAYI